MKRTRASSMPTLFNWTNESIPTKSKDEWKIPGKETNLDIVFDELLERLKARKNYLKEIYSGDSLKTAIFEMEVFEKVVRKSFEKKEVQPIKRKRKF